MSFSPLNFFIPGVGVANPSGGGGDVIATTWAAIGPPTTPGQVRRVTDIGPAPGIELVSTGTRWRPRGGRQVLAMCRTQITIQGLAYTLFETIGPFPGGLIKQGMGLEVDLLASAGAVSATGRRIQVLIGGTPQTITSPVNTIIAAEITVNSLTASARFGSQFNAANDTGGPHPTGLTYNFPYGIDSVSSGIYGLNVNLASPFYVTLIGRSVSETAVAISSATWAGGIATFNTAAAHTLAVGDKTVTAGVTPAGWNIPAGAIVLSVPTTTQFTVALAADPGAYTSGGTSSRISNVTSQSYVLELVG